MSYMFLGCNNLDEINLSFFDTSNVVNMEGMFYISKDPVPFYVDEIKLKNIDLSFF